MGKTNHKMEIISKWKLVRDHPVSMLFFIKVDGNRISVMQKDLKGILVWVTVTGVNNLLDILSWPPVLTKQLW